MPKVRKRGSPYAFRWSGRVNAVPQSMRDGSYGPAAAWLESEIHDCDEVVESTRRFLADPGSPLPRYTRRVVEHGLELARVRGSWLREVRDALAEESGDVPADGAPAEERLRSDGSR